MLVCIGFKLVPVAVDVYVLMLAVVDELRAALDVMVLLAADVAHETRDMSAATTSQKKPALNSMTATCIEEKLG